MGCCQASLTGNVPLEKVAGKLRSGDLLLFRHIVTPKSTFLQTAVCHRMDHAGMIVMDPTKKGIESVMVAHATGKGVTLQPLTEELESRNYREVHIRPLIRPLSDKQLIKLQAFVKAHTGQSYNWDLWEVGKSTLDCCDRCPCACLRSLTKNDVERSDRFFCSDYVARIYKEIGLLKTNRTSEEFTPEDLNHITGLYAPFIALQLPPPKPTCMRWLCCCFCCCPPQPGAADVEERPLLSQDDVKYDEINEDEAVAEPPASAAAPASAPAPISPPGSVPANAGPPPSDKLS